MKQTLANLLRETTAEQDVQCVVLLYHWGSTGPLRPAAAGSSPPPPRSDGRCYKALLDETQKSKVSVTETWK